MARRAAKARDDIRTTRETRKKQQNRHGVNDHGGQSNRSTPSPSRDQSSDSEERPTPRFPLFGHGTYGGPTPYGDAQSSGRLSQDVRDTASDPERGRLESNPRQRGKGNAPWRSPTSAQHGQSANRSVAFASVCAFYKYDHPSPRLTTTVATDSSPLSLPYTVLENQYDWIWSLALAERNGYSFRTSLGGAGSWIISPNNEATPLERGPHDKLYLRIWPTSPGYARTSRPPRSQDPGKAAPYSILILLDSGAEINVAGKHWESVLSLSTGPHSAVCGIGNFIVQSLALGHLTVTFDRAAPAPTLLAHGFDDAISLRGPIINDIGTLTDPTYESDTHNESTNVDATHESWTPQRHPALSTATQLHSSLDMTDPTSIRKTLMATGVKPITIRDGQLVIDPAHSEASSRKFIVPNSVTAVSTNIAALPPPGTYSSLDTTRKFIRSVSGMLLLLQLGQHLAFTKGGTGFSQSGGNAVSMPINEPAPAALTFERQCARLQWLADLEGVGARQGHLAGDETSIAEETTNFNRDNLGTDDLYWLHTSFFEDYICLAKLASDPPIILPNVFSIDDSAPIRSVKAAGWKPAIEFDRVFTKFQSVEYVTTAHRSNTIAKYGDDSVKNLRIVIPFPEQQAPDGTATRYTARSTFADIAAQSTNADKFSACLPSSTMRFMLALACAHLHGTSKGPKDGGLVHYAHIPPGLEEFGFPTRTPSGAQDLVYIRGNVPGRRDAGKIWDQVYTKFLLDYGFQQSVVDRRMFYLKVKAEDSDKANKSRSRRTHLIDRGGGC
jgi:hypothetical protein